MKESIVTLILCALFVACAGQDKNVKQAADSSAAAADTVMPAALEGNENMLFGFPGGQGIALTKKHFVILYDTTTLVPEWVAYHLTAENVQGSANRQDDFRPDPDLPEGKRSELSDYKNSGYDRGHLAPAADFKRSEEAMSETFFLSNMAPQRPNLNRMSWSHLEEEVRTLAKKHGAFGSLRVLSISTVLIRTADRVSLSNEQRRRANTFLQGHTV